MASDYGDTPTRYGQLFGTPERTAETIAWMCGTIGVMRCDGGSCRCPVFDACDGEPTAREIALWLRGEYDEKRVRAGLGY